MTERTEIERLDLVARAEPIKASLTRNAVVFTFLSAFIILLAIDSEASRYETIVVRAFALITVLTTGMLWLRSRYALYAMGVTFLGTLSAGLLPFDDPDNHTLLGASAWLAGAALLLWVGYRCWTNAKPFSDAHSRALEKERSQVHQWMDELDSPGRSDQFIEFSSKSFWTGYSTYRLLNTGSCWLVERFKMGKLSRLLECRVRDLGSVRVVNQSEGKLGIQLGDKSISNVQATSDTLNRLSRLASA